MTKNGDNAPWWTFDECRVCTILRLLAMGAVIGACLVGIWVLVTH